jgi:hypothetical protein
MNKRLCIGLVSPSELLISVLDSIGVWYEAINNSSDIEDYCLFIIEQNTFLDSNQLDKIKTHVAKGGTILEISSSPIFYKGTINSSFKRTLINTTSDPLFSRVSYLDIYNKCSLTNSDILSGLIDFKENSESGLIGFIGLDLDQIQSNSHFTRKRFPSQYGNLPDEIVSKISFGVLSDIIEFSIQRILLKQEFPLIKKWNSPKNNPVFCFRIDSDYGTKESLLSIKKLLDKHQISGSWFLHVKAHESWLEFFSDFKDQELALHGYSHGYSDSKPAIEKDIERGLSVLADHEIEPVGFCAPYGIWNTSLSEALKKFDFTYTSEFTCGYDSDPFYQGSNLQIPIHPICTGSLSRKRYSIDSMKQYFSDIYVAKVSNHKPVIFYHHPLQKGLEVFDKIFELVNSDDLTVLTFEEYANFWIRRSKCEFNAYITNNGIEITSNDPSLLLSISTNPNSFELITTKKQLIPKEIKASFKYETPSLPSVEELKALNENRFSLLKTSFIDWKNRHRL